MQLTLALRLRDELARTVSRAAIGSESSLFSLNIDTNPGWLGLIRAKSAPSPGDKYSDHIHSANEHAAALSTTTSHNNNRPAAFTLKVSFSFSQQPPTNQCVFEPAGWRVGRLMGWLADGAGGLCESEGARRWSWK